MWCDEIQNDVIELNHRTEKKKRRKEGRMNILKKERERERRWQTVGAAKSQVLQFTTMWTNKCGLWTSLAEFLLTAVLLPLSQSLFIFISIYLFSTSSSTLLSFISLSLRQWQWQWLPTPVCWKRCPCICLCIYVRPLLSSLLLSSHYQKLSSSSFLFPLSSSYLLIFLSSFLLLL